MRRTRLAVSVASISAVAGLAVGAVMVSGNTSILSSLASSSSTAASPSPPTGHHKPHGKGGHGDFGRPEFGPMVTGTITQISGSTITLRTINGNVTVTTNSSTKYSKEEKSISLSNLGDGDVITARGAAPTKPTTPPTKPATPRTQRQAPTPITSLTAASIEVKVASLSGKVTSVSGSTITVLNRDGTYEYITTSGSTSYTSAGKSASASAVTTGSFVEAQGTQTDLTHLNADTVNVGKGGEAFFPPAA